MGQTITRTNSWCIFLGIYCSTNTRWMVSGEIWTSYNYIYRNDPSFYVNSSDANLCEVQSVPPHDVSYMYRYW
jgi:hypothetical protein